MNALKILVLEDSKDDAFLIDRTLRTSGMQLETLLVEDKAGFEKALMDFQPDVILCDHSLPGFGSLQAFDLYKRRQAETRVVVPFILVSGSLPEDVAIQLVRNGAHDYILKDRLKRLPLAIVNALEKCRAENESSQYLRQLVVKEALMREAEALARLGSWQIDLTTGEHTWSDMLYSIYGYETREVRPGHAPFLARVHPDDRPLLNTGMDNLHDWEREGQRDFRIVDNSGHLKYLSCACKVVRDGAGRPLKLVGINLDVTERKQAEIALRQQEQQYRSLFDQNPDPILSLDLNGRLTSVNTALTDLSGFRSDELAGRELVRIFHPDDVPAVDMHFMASRERQSQRYEARLVTATGGIVYLDVTSIPIVVDEKVTGVHMVAKDISDTRKLTNLLDEVYRQSRTGAWELDVAKGKLRWTGITKELHEVDASFEPDVEAAIKFYKEGDSRDKIRNAVDRAIQYGTAWDLELEITTAKGNDRWVKAIGGVEMKNGKCIRLFGTFQDIHDRKLAELGLQEAYCEKSRILESIGDAFFAVDNQWIVTYWNKQAEQLLGRPRESIIGRNLWEMYPEAKSLSFFTQYHRAKEAGVPVHFQEYYPPLSLWLQVNAYPSAAGLSIYFTDVTEQKKREQELRHQNSRLKEIAWLQSHELRAPVARILGLTNLIKGGLLINEGELSTVLKDIENSTVELDSVVRRIVRKTEEESRNGKPVAGVHPPLLCKTFKRG